MSRRTRIALIVPLVLVGMWFAVTGWIRAHVNDLIQHAVGRPLPEFSLPDRGGRPWSNADLAGKRALVHFFRSRCHSCDLEAPALRELEAKLPADAVLLHVMTDAVLGFPAEQTAETIAKKGFQKPVLMADAKFVDAFHQVKWSNVTPVTYVVDGTGVIRFGLRGAQTVASLEAALAAAQ
jgi:cytochrome c biogenesis protein CcmG/thiol:disulfide interchange protein DsbE